MADCSKTVEFFTEWDRLCNEMNSGCNVCPMYLWNHAEDKESCMDHWYAHPKEAVEILQKWSDEHPVMTWEGKLRALLPHAPIAEIMHEYCPKQIFGDPAPFDIDCGGEGTEACLACWRSEYKEAIT